MKRVDQWEVVAAVARHVSETRPTSGKTHCASAYRIALDLDKLARIARSLDRLNTDACNIPVRACYSCEHDTHETSASHTPRRCHYARVERLEKRAELIGTELGCVVSTQRDPRGPAIRVWADREDGKLLGVFS